MIDAIGGIGDIARVKMWLVTLNGSHVARFAVMHNT